jgi:hypothetical protein
MTMPTPTCVFELVNSGSNGLRLILEPEGAEFVLPPGESIQIHLFGPELPLAIKQSTDENGRSLIAFWPDKGTYELFFKGRRIWDQI